MKSQQGFIIYDMCEVGRVRLYELDATVTFDHVTTCPLCLESLRPLCSLVGEQGAVKLLVGGCPVCGYIGYQDRPSEQWMVNFYLTTWDDHIALSEREVKNLPSITTERKSSRRLAAELGCSLVSGQGKSFLEIGSGYGQVLRYMSEQGFSNVVGVENSKHRAGVVSKAFNVPVAVGNFEGPSVQESLKTHGMFDLILSHHVFEHVSHPEAFISALSKLQPDGGVLVLSVPDVVGEHAGYVALYPPHLHSYSKYGIEVLLNRYGYEIIEDQSPGLDNILIAARKVAQPVAHMEKPQDALADSLNKLQRGLGIKDVPTHGLAQLWWLEPGRGYDDARVSQQAFGIPLLERIWWGATKGALWLKAKIGRIIASHGMLVGPLSKRYTDTPIELQWKGPIRFLFK